ncbi:MAG: hypothetical protein ASARMPREDX12_006794 [Alectoria sarmentosa]|nr:MAG: hypothetical protein ASARMPREDX12_006794 [Alectoria sarmentosa]
MCRIERFDVIYPNGTRERREELNHCRRGTRSQPCRHVQVSNLEDRLASASDLRHEIQSHIVPIEPRDSESSRLRPSSRETPRGPIQGLTLNLKFWNPFSSKTEEKKEKTKYFFVRRTRKPEPRSPVIKHQSPIPPPPEPYLSTPVRGGSPVVIPIQHPVNHTTHHLPEQTNHPPHQKQTVNTIDAPDPYHCSADTKSRKRLSDKESLDKESLDKESLDKESLDKESVEKESRGKNAKLGSEPKGASGRSGSGRSIGNPERDSVSQLSGKQDVSKKRGTEKKREDYRSKKTLSVSEPLTERGNSVKNGHGDNKRKKTVNVAELLTTTEYGDSVTNKPDADMQKNNVMLVHAKPIFPALRIILSLFTKMKAI